VTFTVVAQPFSEIYRRFEADPAHGPDLFIAPNDALGTEVRAGLLADVTAAMAARAANLTPPARTGARLSGKFYMIPESTKAVALYYRASGVPTVPMTTWALLDAVRGGLRLGFVANSYYAAGLYWAFGGQLIDSTYRCIADRTPGVAQALDYLRRLKEAGATVYEIAGTRTMYDDFIAGRINAVIDGNWVAADYRAAVGADLRVATLPLGPDGMSRPFDGVDGWYINARRARTVLAAKVALAMSDSAYQLAAMTAAGHVPADKTIPVVDPITSGFAIETALGAARPLGKGFENYWGPFETAIVNVVIGGADAATAVNTACSAMNAANGR
jgi:arabinogalactan oligomer/maltooligosaccharide transport system substrate-binding protein